MPAKSSHKGGAFERKIGKTLSLWISAGADDTLLIRTQSSGGWATSRAQRGLVLPTQDAWRHTGDLAPNGPLGDAFRRKFVVECKHRNNINLDDAWSCNADRDCLLSWWKKLMQESESVNAQPMLIYRCTGRELFVGLRTDAVPTQVQASLFPWLELAVFPFSQLLVLNPKPFL